KAADKESEKDKEKEKSKAFTIDLEGIQDRIVALPMDPSNIRSFNVGKGYIYYSSSPIQGLSGPLPGESTEVHAYDLKERKDKALISDVDPFTISFDSSKIIYQAQDRGYGIIDAKPDNQKKPGDGKLNLSGMRAEIDPPQEWKQMFNEVWRQER